jgi:hypothetical protein
MNQTHQQRQLTALWDRARTFKPDELFRNLQALLARDVMSSIPDGFPPGGEGGGNGTNTPVEGAYFARTARSRDEVTLASRRGLQAALALVDAMEGMAAAHRSVFWPATEDRPEQCESCKRANIPQAASIFGNCAGRLERKWRLCDSCRKFVGAYGRVPTEAELRNHAGTGRWRVVADPRTVPFQWRDGSTTGITPTPPTAA